MVYDHASKVGNRGDVWKHFALLTAVASLQRRKSERILYRESHSGRAEYVLPDKGAWREGIGRLLPTCELLANHPYFAQFGAPLRPGDTYPGSWLQVGKILSNRYARFSTELHDTSPDV